MPLQPISSVAVFCRNSISYIDYVSLILHRPYAYLIANAIVTQMLAELKVCNKYSIPRYTRLYRAVVCQVQLDALQIGA